tara:strand:+ start:1140 stop:1325 length:186 start_codon:yes stop_codon:yes gene_type:complete
MAGCLVANYDLTHEEGYQRHISTVGATIFAYGGEILVAGPGSEAVMGIREGTMNYYKGCTS